jgi:hypothetical protein
MKPATGEYEPCLPCDIACTSPRVIDIDIGRRFEMEADAGTLTIFCCSWDHPERASRGWPAGSPPSCRP